MSIHNYFSTAFCRPLQVATWYTPKKGTILDSIHRMRHLSSRGMTLRQAHSTRGQWTLDTGALHEGWRLYQLPHNFLEWTTSRSFKRDWFYNNVDLISDIYGAFWVSPWKILSQVPCGCCSYPSSVGFCQLKWAYNQSFGFFLKCIVILSFLISWLKFHWCFLWPFRLLSCCYRTVRSSIGWVNWSLGFCGSWSKITPCGRCPLPLYRTARGIHHVTLSANRNRRTSRINCITLY